MSKELDFLVKAIHSWQHDHNRPCCNMPEPFCNCEDYELSKEEENEMNEGYAQAEIDSCMDCWGGVECSCPPKSWQIEDNNEVIANAIGFPLWAKDKHNGRAWGTLDKYGFAPKTLKVEHSTMRVVQKGLYNFECGVFGNNCHDHSPHCPQHPDNNHLPDTERYFVDFNGVEKPIE